MAPKDPQGRLYSLDALRATMMLLGIVLHTVVSYVPIEIGPAWPFQDTDQTIWALVALGLIHAFRMQVFFVLAGFFTSLMIERRGVAGLVRNRLGRLGIPLVVGTVLLWPLVVAAFVFAGGALQGSISDGIVAVSQVPAIVFLIPQSFSHLWFIYYLLYYYAAYLAIRAVLNRLPQATRNSLSAFFGALASRPVLRVAVLTLASTLTLLPAGGRLDPPHSFLPEIIGLVSYFVYFAFGALLYRHRHIIGRFVRLAWTQVIIACIVFLGFHYVLQPTLEIDDNTLSIARSIVNAISSWLFSFGLIGLFIRYLDHPSARFRYVVDASYWIYLVHLPIVVFFSGLFAVTSLPVWPKILATMACTTLVGFVSYDVLVRSSFIGRTLNGRRYRRGVPSTSEISG